MVIDMKYYHTTLEGTSLPDFLRKPAGTIGVYLVDKADLQVMNNNLTSYASRTEAKVAISSQDIIYNDTIKKIVFVTIVMSGRERQKKGRKLGGKNASKD